MNYDLVVIGGGAGGLSAARSANWHGKNVALISDGPLGGDCTFTGCVPSKALIAASKRGESFTEAMQRVAATVDTIAATETADVLRGEGIDVVEGRAILTTGRNVTVNGTTIATRKTIVATGARASSVPIPGLDEVPILTNENIFDLREAPVSLMVLGGGPIGCELAQAFSRLGVHVTLFEAAERLLSREDPEASAVIAESLRVMGVDVRIGAAVSRFSGSGPIVAEVDGGLVTAEALLVAVGRKPNTAQMGLAEAGVELDKRGFIVTNEKLRTSNKDVFAVGDVTGRMALTHAADEMGRLAAGNALRFFPRGPFSTRAIPWVTFTDPEVATVGMSEHEAASQGGRVAYLPMTEMDRAITDGDTRGFIKLIAGPKRVLGNLGGGKFLGATIVGPRAGEMIHEVSLAMRTNMFAGRIAQAVHAYPTGSYGIQKCAGQFFFEIEGRSARPAEESAPPWG